MADTNEYYIVKVGDDLPKIAKAHNTTEAELARLNNLSYPYKVVVGQKLIIKGNPNTKTDNGSTVTIDAFGLLADTTRTIFVSWIWDQENTENYQVKWSYYTKNGIWFSGSTSTTSDGDTKNSTYNAPENATLVKVTIKPIAKTSSTAGTTTNLWTGTWSTEKLYSFAKNPPSVPPVPNVEIIKYKLTATLENVRLTNTTHVEFQVIKDDSVSYHKGTASITTIDDTGSSHVSYSCTIEAGHNYKVRCRGVSTATNLYSEWTDYSSSIKSLPTPTTITDCKVVNKNRVQITWTNVKSADGYYVEYTTKKENFDVIGGDVENQTITTADSEKDGDYISRIFDIATGTEYFVRMKAINSDAESDWSDIVSFKIGLKPTAPTTWSSTTNAEIGNPLKLYWIHNAEDGSNQTSAKLKIIRNGNELIYLVPPYEYDSGNMVKSITKTDPEDENCNTYVCTIDTEHTSLLEGSKIEWSVCTAGVKEDSYGNPEYGDYSILRTVDIYSPPVVSIDLVDKDNLSISELTSFPFYANCVTGNAVNQQPTGYYISVISDESYETVDSVGNNRIVASGSEIYSEYFDTNNSILSVEFSASNLNLENNITYTVRVTVSMSSGLIAESSTKIKIAWDGITYAPVAEIGINEDDISAYIRPYVYRGDNDVLLSVYRREYDGSFTELATDLDNSLNTFVTDPHPALDYARYRVVAKSKTTGTISFTDIPGYLVGVKSVVIQWDETWQNFETSDDVMEEPAWVGSMLKIPYNIDISDGNSKDISLVKYAGRKRPVSYYGTQLGEKSTWNVEIPKNDKETLYAIRRLSIWMGDVYVREPSGIGYWANIEVNYNVNHRSTTIPVTFNITRVEGGI